MKTFIKKINLLGILFTFFAFALFSTSALAKEDAKTLGKPKTKQKVDLKVAYQDMLQAVEKYMEEVGKETAIVPENDIAIMFTELGYVAIHLEAKEAKKSLRAIRVLVKSGFYDNLEFFRSVPSYFVQFGDPSSSGGGGSGVFVEDEFTNARSHVRGTVSMANFGTPNSQDSQLVISLNRSPWLNGKQTIIGTVIYGIDTVEKISLVPTLENGIVANPFRITKMVMYDKVNEIDPTYYESLSEVTSNNKNKIIEKNIEFEKEIKALKGSERKEENIEDETKNDKATENTADKPSASSSAPKPVAENPAPSTTTNVDENSQNTTPPTVAPVADGNQVQQPAATTQRQRAR